MTDGRTDRRTEPKTIVPFGFAGRGLINQWMRKNIHGNNNNLRFWIARSAAVFRNLAVLASFISMDLIYENLTFHWILFLMFSILKLSHPVKNALELLSFLKVQKLHIITFFLSYINQGRPFFQLSCLENARNTDVSLRFEPTRAWTYDGQGWVQLL